LHCRPYLRRTDPAGTLVQARSDCQAPR
jgi:hypothetical protein